ncbi:hypothetical protein EV182_006530, partial [Spiromyces aspiralis]
MVFVQTIAYRPSTASGMGKYAATAAATASNDTSTSASIKAENLPPLPTKDLPPSGIVAVRNFIGGEWVDPSTGEYVTVDNP